MDTLALSNSLMEKLRAAGFDEKQARALAESQAEAAEASARENKVAVQDAIRESKTTVEAAIIENRHELATKGDLAELRSEMNTKFAKLDTRIARIEAKQGIIFWVLGLLAAGHIATFALVVSLAVRL